MVLLQFTKMFHSITIQAILSESLWELNYNLRGWRSRVRCRVHPCSHGFLNGFSLQFTNVVMWSSLHQGSTLLGGERVAAPGYEPPMSGERSLLTWTRDVSEPTRATRPLTAASRCIVGQPWSTKSSTEHPPEQSPLMGSWSWIWGGVRLYLCY